MLEGRAHCPTSSSLAFLIYEMGTKAVSPASAQKTGTSGYLLKTGAVWAACWGHSQPPRNRLEGRSRHLEGVSTPWPSDSTPRNLSTDTHPRSFPVERENYKPREKFGTLGSC